MSEVLLATHPMPIALLFLNPDPPQPQYYFSVMHISVPGANQQLAGREKLVISPRTPGDNRLLSKKLRTLIEGSSEEKRHTRGREKDSVN